MLPIKLSLFHKDQALAFNNVGWTVYDDDWITENDGVGWHHTGSIPVSAHVHVCMYHSLKCM